VNLEKRTVRVRITGRVQGVSYRAWTEHTAKVMRLSGWVRNRRDGSVDALFSGGAVEVEAMLDKCRKGPFGAVVEKLTIVEEGGCAEALTGFAILPAV
jgi:acylphosphatase